VWCTVNRYGIFAKMFITSSLPSPLREEKSFSQRAF
jgi:hypothetical protein